MEPDLGLASCWRSLRRGRFEPLAFSDLGNHLTGQAKFGGLVESAEDTLSDDAVKVAAGILVGIGGTVLAAKYVMPQARKLTARFKGEAPNEGTELVVFDAVRVGHFAESVDTALAELQPEMSNEEAQRRLLNTGLLHDWVTVDPSPRP